MAENIRLADLIRGLRHTDRVIHGHLESGGEINRKFGYRVRGARAGAAAQEWGAEEKHVEDRAPAGQWEQ